MIRQPVFAGQFYPANPTDLRVEVERMLGAAAVPPPTGRPALALIAPHAGYVYSGRVAGATYAAAELPHTLVILCPNHTGRGSSLAVMNEGSWETPLGRVPIDGTLADRILEEVAEASVDALAHLREHSLEVQLPFLQVKLGEFSMVPICVGTQRLDLLIEVGHGVGRALARHASPAAIVVSSDMSHYIPAEEARMKDMMAIERITALDPEGLHRVVREHDISMCGYAPAVAGLTAAVDRGATTACLVDYANSGEASGDETRVVGYAGLTVS